MIRKRIGWLDSTRAPSHIHATDDEGETTVCGNHRPKDRMREANAPCDRVEPRNVISEVPRKILGRSRYCKGGCFEKGSHSIPWVTPPSPEELLENGLLKPAVLVHLEPPSETSWVLKVDSPSRTSFYGPRTMPVKTKREAEKFPSKLAAEREIECLRDSGFAHLLVAEECVEDD